MFKKIRGITDLGCSLTFGFHMIGLVTRPIKIIDPVK